MSELLDQTRALMRLRHYNYKTELVINSNAVDNTLNFEYCRWENQKAAKV